MNPFRRTRGGYTIIEMVVVLAILGLLAALSMPVVDVVQHRERERELRRALWEIRDALDAWRRASEAGALSKAVGAAPYPPALLALQQSHPDQRPDRRGETLRFLRKVPRDPFADPSLPAELSWGLRGYQSEADAPKAGAEVFDVYSLSSKVGLNGVPLREW
ncbi:prepilin-type N-terminal cleavage/methylation domain-containing protein [Pseudorhodoferax sp.]|uniref:prepilin-type N-terminal cleavage/methylation domain-containing protein n=1 Tax=Pseudorhodoferax sp. TaxID=1993553 RepID=UPI002DD6434D|nr:prepilin-type N-terminal cleavage/methylation domain-containing protein [Pseudorhodoferax sp.]